MRYYLIMQPAIAIIFFSETTEAMSEKLVFGVCQVFTVHINFMIIDTLPQCVRLIRLLVGFRTTLTHCTFFHSFIHFISFIPLFSFLPLTLTCRLSSPLPWLWGCAQILGFGLDT